LNFLKIYIDEDFSLTLETSILKQFWSSKHENDLDVNVLYSIPSVLEYYGVEMNHSSYYLRILKLIQISARVQMGWIPSHLLDECGQISLIILVWI